MRYLGRDRENTYIKCHHCGKVLIIPGESFQQPDHKKCPSCGRGFSIVWGWTPGIVRGIRRMLAVFTMPLISAAFLAVLCCHELQRHVRFNQFILDFKTEWLAILVEVISTVLSISISFISLAKEKPKPTRISTGRHWLIANCVMLPVEFITLIILTCVVIQNQYTYLEIPNPDSNETQYYYGNAVGNVASGEGRIFDNQGNLIYWGEFCNNSYDGQGKLFRAVLDLNGNSKFRLIYEGEFKNGKADGYGKEYEYTEEYTFQKDPETDPHLCYEGYFREGEYCGSGTYYGRDKKYIGSFSDGKFFGYGKYWWINSSSHTIHQIQGNYWNGEIHGKGTKFWPDGTLMFDGTYDNGYATQGTIFRSDGTKEYEGEWDGTVYEGFGTSYRSNGTKEYEGYWEHGVYHGTGTLYDEDETPKHIGIFEDGKFISPSDGPNE